MHADSAATTAAADPAALVDGVVEAILAGDIPAIAGFLTADAVWEVKGATYMPKGWRFEGRDAILEDFLVGTVLEAFDFSAPFSIDVEHVHVDGDTAIVEWHVSATSARGGRYENDYCLVVETSGGAIRAVREYCNTEMAKRVLFE